MVRRLIPSLAGLLPLYVIRFSLFEIPTNLFEILAAVAFMVAIFDRGFRDDMGRATRSLGVCRQVFIILFLFSALVSTVISPNLNSSLGILKGWIVIPCIVAILFYTESFSSPDSRRKILSFLSLSGLVVALLGISQIHYFERIRSLYDVPNSLALFLVPLSILSFWIGIREKNYFYQLSFLVMSVAIIATQSVAAIGATMLTLLIGVICYRGIVPVSKMISALLFAAILVITFLTTTGRIQYLVSPFSQKSNSITVRVQLWDIGFRLIRDNPLLGVGLGQFEPAYQQQLHTLFAQPEKKRSFYPLQREFVFRDPHNWIISFWLNLGFLGLISFIYLNWNSIRTAMQSKNVEAQAIGLVMVSILLFGLSDTVYWKNDLSVLWWILVMVGFL